MKSLRIKNILAKGKTVNLRFTGRVDEDVSSKEIEDQVSSEIGVSTEITVDVGDIDYINSCGSREWIKWVQTVTSDKSLKFINCGIVFLDYANMIEGFIPRNGSIESFQIPYFCGSCNAITLKTFERQRIKDVSKDIAPTVDCAKCNQAASIDVIVPGFFKFLKKN